MQLQILDFDVLVFQSAKELLASEFPTHNACLLVDVYMPEISGIELCRSLAASGRLPPAILMTAHDDDVTRQIIHQAEPTASLFKPFDEDALLRAIRKGLRNVAKLPH
jgi:FixJ family two-component response regulator